MKATIDFDDTLYRRLKIEAARRGRTVRELVAEGVQYVLDTPDMTGAKGAALGTPDTPWNPAWIGSLAGFAAKVDDHSMPAVRRSIATARARGGKR